MKPVLPMPDRNFLLERFTYDMDSGQLFWKERPASDFKSLGKFLRWHKQCSGKSIGTKCHTQKGEPHRLSVKITIAGIRYTYSAHRIIFGIMGVEIPEGMEVDHRDKNPFNNKWENLRVATPSQNQCNKPSTRHKYNMPKGVNFSNNKKFPYFAAINLNKKQIHLGIFKTIQEASEAYIDASKIYHGEFARVETYVNGKSSR